MATPLKKLEEQDLLVAAFTAMQTNQYSLAIKHFKEVLRRDPEDPFAYLEMAKCYHAVDEADKLHTCIKNAFRLAKQDTNILLNISQVCQTTRNYADSIKALKLAEKEASLRHTAIVRQAEVYELSNQLEQVEVALEKIEDEPTTLASQAIKAKLYRRRGAYDQAKLILEDLIQESKSKDKAFASSLQYELAMILDKLGLYSQVSTVLNSAKSYHINTDSAKIAAEGRKGVVQALRGLCSSVTAEDLEQWREEVVQISSQTNQSQKLCFLLGHPRSGTTLIEQALDAHPKLTSADETPIFHNTVWMPTVLQQTQMKVNYSDYLQNLSRNTLRKLRRDYQLHWKSTKLEDRNSNAPFLLDKNPALTTRLGVITRFFPDAQIIFAIRDPRDVIISSYMQPVGVNDWSVNWLTLSETVEYYCFAMQMWLDIRDKLINPWVEVRYEDCVNDLTREAKRVTTQLGLNWHVEQEDIRSHVRKKVVYSPTYADVGEKIYHSSVGRWKNYKNLLDPFQEKLAPFVGTFGYSESS